jgi:hypothetical protein
MIGRALVGAGLSKNYFAEKLLGWGVRLLEEI